ncbi:dihydropteroate synthase [Pleionea sediminis]|uniref:dihydropteroate synthase n=1 Tax=Pleionea sediminis TaxID=2569479 RepID=UPI0011859FBF|nr:dihydropteroate synthase [Pleionea sediminis]
MHSLYQSDLPQIMGVLNITPDSFSDGGSFIDPIKARSRAEAMIEEGVDIIDVGGESTRPGAKEVSINEELDRVIPVIEAIANLGKPVSIDTSKSVVMLEAAKAGAAMINDVRALQEDGALESAAQTGLPICLMHMQGKPRTMQTNPTYDDVVADVLRFLELRIRRCEAAGIDRSLLSIDPGFGFGKSLEHNLHMLKNLERFQNLNLPVLVGMSRKSMLGQITDKPVEKRLAAGISVALIAAIKKANIIRVHDVAETRDAICVFGAVYNEEI